MNFCKVSILLLAIATGSTAKGQAAYDALLSTLYSHTVPTVSADSLSQLAAGNSVVILDTRSKEEFEVSHLPKAKWVDYDTFDSSIVSGIAKDAVIVVYCSVGYRSEKIGEKLKQLGFSSVQNLYGGIFQWKNEGKVVVNMRNQPTDSVHAYSKLWSIWLKDGIKVYE